MESNVYKALTNVPQPTLHSSSDSFFPSPSSIFQVPAPHLKLPRPLTPLLQVSSILWSQHSKELVTGHGYLQNQLTVWKYPSMTRIAELTGHQDRVLQLAMSPDGSTVVSLGADESIRLWKVFESCTERKGKKGGESVTRSMSKLSMNCR